MVERDLASLLAVNSNVPSLFSATSRARAVDAVKKQKQTAIVRVLFSPQIDGQANKIGYFYDPSADFRVTEAGVWTVNVNIWHDGQTSAGPTQEPFPTGDVLGSNAGEFKFYVVERGSFPLAVEEPESVWVKPGKGIVPITTTPPPDWSDVQLHYSTVK